MKPGWKWLSAACVAASLSFAALGAAAQGMPIADGTHWMASSDAEKTAFVIGVANTLALELAYATKTGKTDLSAGDRASKVLANVSIADVSSRITAWYRANPGRMNMPVVGVIWVDMVKPKLAQKG